MAGHSKWKNIRERKGKSDAQRGKIFTKVAREISVAVKEGGSDPTSNARLRDAIAKARAANMPNDNIKRNIEKAGGGDGANYEVNTYEGYGPSGVAVIVETMTDNKNRTAADMRHYFDKYGGNLGAEGCVSWSFDKKGVLVIDKVNCREAAREDPLGGNENAKLDEDTIMLDALDAGAADFESEDGMFVVYTTPEAFGDVRTALEEKGYNFLSAQVEMVPQNYIKLETDEDVKKMEKLLTMLEDSDDVQSVWHSWEE
ncbi:MAG: YebC/PmpR family DNA-binding transcriptional regulator [Oscillospiraceae bacterium]|nr:YebC/PmpR family DNA-binding transcriptional regulator [Oscillospiraceae bacterium]